MGFGANEKAMVLVGRDSQVEAFKEKKTKKEGSGN